MSTDLGFCCGGPQVTEGLEAPTSGTTVIDGDQSWCPEDLGEMMSANAKKALTSGYTLRKPPSREDPTIQLWSPDGHWLADIRERAHPGSAEAICSAMNMVFANQLRLSAGLQQPGGLPDEGGCPA